MLLVSYREKTEKERIGWLGFVVLSVLVLPLFYLSDPSDAAWGAESVAPLKYLPVFLAVFGIGIAFLRKPYSILSFSTLCVSALFVIMLFGGLSTVSQGYELKESFVGRALSIVLFFLGWWSVFERSEVAEPYRG